MLFCLVFVSETHQHFASWQKLVPEVRLAMGILTLSTSRHWLVSFNSSGCCFSAQHSLLVYRNSDTFCTSIINVFFFRLPRSLRIFNQHPHTGQGNRELWKSALKSLFFFLLYSWIGLQSWLWYWLLSLLPQLAAIKLARYGEDLLFYLYYMNGGDLLQLLAAVELWVILVFVFFFFLQWKLLLSEIL